MPDSTPETLLAVLDAFENKPSEESDASMRSILPALKTLVETDQHLRTVAAEGRKTLAQTATILRGVSDSTATASQEIFEILKNIVYSDQDLILKGSSQEIRDQLMEAMNALQFQDIVSQQVTAIQTLFEAFDQVLAPLADAPIEADLEVDIEGAFDATASFDRERIDVDDLDAWINEAKNEGDKK